jgi:hypothetical protein
MPVAERTWALMPPIEIAAFSRPKPLTVTTVPAGAWAVETETASVQAMPPANTDPSPLARS